MNAIEHEQPSTPTLRSVLIWAGLLSITLFVTGRAHYFFRSPYQLQTMAYDSSWWWSYQELIANPELVQGNPFHADRLAARFGTDYALQDAIVRVSQALGVSRLQINLVITAGLYLAAFLAIFALGWYVLRSPAWAFFFTFVLAQSEFAAWLRYPIFTPKMIGFALYPVVVLLLLNATLTGKRWSWTILLSAVSILLYPASPMYYLPFWTPACFAVACTQAREREDVALLLKRLGLLVVVCMFALLAIRTLNGPKSPPELQVTELLYRSHYFKFSHYVKAYVDYVLLVVAGFALLTFWRTTDKRTSQLTRVLVLAFTVSLAVAIVAHAMALHVPQIRMLWYWRVAYYCYLPGLLFIVLALKHLAEQQEWSRHTLRISCVLLCAWVTYRATSYNATGIVGSLKTIKHVAVGGGFQEDEQAHHDLIAWIRKTPPESRILMPDPRHQGTRGVLVETDAHRFCLLGHVASGALVLDMPTTKDYSRTLVEYRRVLAIPDPHQRSAEIREFASRHETPYLLQRLKNLPREELPDLPVLFQNKRWIVYGVPATTDALRQASSPPTEDRTSRR